MLKKIAIALGVLLSLLLILPLLGLGLLFIIAEPPAQAVRLTTEFDAQLPALELGGYRYHLEARGPREAPVLIGLHGGAGNDYRSIEDLWQLSDSYRVVLYDQRGAGLSPRVADEQLTVPQMIADLKEVIEHHSPERPVHLVGHSWGAMLATAYIAQHPEDVERVVLLEPGMLTPQTGKIFMERFQARFRPGPGDLLAMARAAMSAAKVEAPEGDDDAVVDTVLLQVAMLDLPSNPMAGYYCGQDPKNARFSYWRMGARANQVIMSSGVDERGQVTVDFSQGLENFPREVLLVASSCNVIIGEDVQRMHQALFRKARLAVIDGAGHTMLAEKPEETLALIRAYLRGE